MFWLLMSRIKRLLDENHESAEEEADECHALEERDGHFQEEGTEIPRIRIDSEETEPDDSSMSEATEGSDAISMAYTVRSTTSLKENTNWFLVPREMRKR